MNWYLKEIESEIDSEEELVNKKGLIEKVLHRLVHYVSVPFLRNAPTDLKSANNCWTITDRVSVFHQDHILIELSQAGLKGSESSSTEEEAVLVVNPNYIMED